MKKVDMVSWTLSIIINITILFLITYKPFFKMEEIQSIKIGLVSIDNTETTKFKNEKNVDALKQNLEANKIVDNKLDEKIEKPIEKSEEKKEIISEAKPVEKQAEKEIENEKSVEVVKEEVKKEKPSLSDLKKSIAASKPNSKDLIKKTESFSPAKGNSETVDRILTVSSDSNGLVSGNINGTSTDGTKIIWSDKNKSPIFPDKAKLQGKTGSMIIKIEVDQAGAVLSYVIEKGSGVPEIDMAVEKVIGSWNLKLQKNNRIVAGIFRLDYKFDFK